MLSILTKNKKMIEAFRKLETNTKSLESIIEATKDSILKEYSLAKEAGYFNEIGKGFDLRICHMDCTTESYPEILANRLRALDKIAKNPKAKELYQSCLEHEIEGLEIALNDMQAYTEGRFIGSFEGRDEIKHYQKVIPEIVSVAEEKLAELKAKLK